MRSRGSQGRLQALLLLALIIIWFGGGLSINLPPPTNPTAPRPANPNPYPQEPISKGERICPQSCLGICLFDAWSNLYQQEEDCGGSEAETAPISVQLETANVVDSWGAAVTQKKAAFDHKGERLGATCTCSDNGGTLPAIESLFDCSTGVPPPSSGCTPPLLPPLQADP